MTNNNNQKINLDSIKKLYGSRAIAKLAFEYFATRKRNKQATAVSRLHAVLLSQGHQASYAEVRDFLKELADLNCGEYIPGRHKRPSRLQWKVGLVALGQAAAGQQAEVKLLTEEEAAEPDQDEMEEITTAQPPTNASDMPISYPLRPTRSVEFVLPKDITTREAHRLAEFIKTLPFDDSTNTSGHQH